jgi:RNA polymerase sigma-70 factor, ECF subfamily
MATSLTLGRIGLLRRSDEDVFGLALGGDPVAFSEVYRRYSKRIYGYCLARMMDREAAADAAQEVFVRFLSAPRDGIEHPRAWLFTVARNVTIDAIRKRARSPQVSDGHETDAREIGPVVGDTLDKVLGREDAHNVFLALRRLRPRYRTALILRELHHETSADMADALDTTPGAVDTLVSRARDAFGRAYGEVTGLPADCRVAVAAIYKRKGSGIDAVEELGLQAHLTVCPHCHKESVRALRVDGLSALLPFLVPSRKIGLDLIERATLALRTSPDLAAQLGYVVPADRLAPALKVAAGLLTLSLVVAVPTVGPHSTSRTGTSSGVAMAASFAPRPSVRSAAAVPGPRCGCISSAQRLLNECGKYGVSQHSSSCSEPDTIASGSGGACDSGSSTASGDASHSTSGGSHSKAADSSHAASGSGSHSTSGSGSRSTSGSTGHDSAPSGTPAEPAPSHGEAGSGSGEHSDPTAPSEPPAEH